MWLTVLEWSKFGCCWLSNQLLVGGCCCCAPTKIHIMVDIEVMLGKTLFYPINVKILRRVMIKGRLHAICF